MLNFFLSFIAAHQCISGLLMKGKELHSDMNSTSRTLMSVDSKRKPIRIMLDTEILDTNTDSTLCKTVGQSVSWQLGTFYCTSDDIMTEKKLKVLKETLKSLEDFASRLLNVSRCTFNIRTKDMYDISVKSKSVDKDLYVAVITRPFGAYSSTLASAFPFSLSYYDNRPIRGGIYINARTIPSEPQNENSVDRKFFATLFHELCHVLGLTEQLYEKWLNRKTGNSWGKKIPIAKYSKNGKNFTILQTPECKQYAENRWNRTEFAPGVAMGVELEDGGGTGTEMSHPEARVYFNEVMVGLSIQPAVISDLVLAMLEDTGYYNVNWSMAEPLAWGAGASIGESELTDFPNSPPVTSFPEHYLCTPSTTSQKTCAYDFSGTASCVSTLSASCPSYSTEGVTFCSAKDFFNPLNYQVRGYYSIPDFIMYKQVDSAHYCNGNSVVGTSDESFGPDSMCLISNIGHYKSPRCYNMYCDEYNNLTINVGNESAVCHSKGENITFTRFTGYIECPDPVLMCSMKRFKKASVFVPTRQKTSAVWLTTNIIIFTAVCCVLVILIVGITSCVIGHIKEKKLLKEIASLQDETDNEMQIHNSLIPNQKTQGQYT